MAPIDIDRDAARDAAQNELSKAIYPRPSLTDQLLEWLDRLLYRITSEAASLPGGWVTVTVLLLLAVIAVLVVIRIARRAMRSSRTADDELFTGHLLTAAEHRATAQRHAAQAEWTPAIQHRLRAVARQLEEDGVLSPAAGRTATELAQDAGRALPDMASEFVSAAGVFNDVSYGEVPGTEDRYRTVASLDDALGLRPSTGAASQASSAQPPWAPVR
ncbi:membrane protein [Mycobacterium sp. SWH-M1]|nr:membrane protein [Mycobacterium sp. SWH-M1]